MDSYSELLARVNTGPYFGPKSRAIVTRAGNGEAEGEMGLQPDRHYYDAGHFNRDGAAVFSRWLGEFLTRTEELTPRPQTGENRNSWEAAAAFWRS